MNAEKETFGKGLLLASMAYIVPPTSVGSYMEYIDYVDVRRRQSANLPPQALLRST